MAFTVEGKDGIKITAGTPEGLRLVLEELSATSEETSESSEEVSPLLTSERVESLGKDANGEDLFEGDYVTGAPNDESFIMKVIPKEDAVGFGIRANIGVEILGEHEDTIDSYEVDSDRFIRLSRDLDEAKEKFAEIKFGEVLRTESRFKVGDKVRIVENSTNGLPVGDDGEIVRVSENDKNGYDYYVKGDRYDSSMIHEDSDLELLKEEDDLLPVGTKVRLLHESSCGDLQKGEVGTIIETDRGCAADLVYKVRVREGLTGYGWLRKDDVEVVEEKSLKVGDKVKVISAEDGTDSGYHGFIIGSIVEVEEVYGNGRIEAYNGNFHQTLLPHHYERESSSTEFRTGDIVKVTETFEDVLGDKALKGKVLEYSNTFRTEFVGTVLLEENHDKIQLVCRNEDRKDVSL